MFYDTYATYVRFFTNLILEMHLVLLQRTQEDESSDILFGIVDLHNSCSQ